MKQLSSRPILLRLTTRNYFGDNISRKHGQKCCPYNQNGKPLSKDKVDEFLSTYNHLTGYPDGPHWNVSDDYTRLTRSFYLNNIFCAVEFVKDLY